MKPSPAVSVASDAARAEAGGAAAVRVAAAGASLCGSSEIGPLLRAGAAFAAAGAADAGPPSARLDVEVNDTAFQVILNGHHDQSLNSK